MNSKMREIERVYARARSGGKKGKGGKDDKKGKSKGKGKGKGPPMDKRLLKVSGHSVRWARFSSLY
jgi:hypothetical protein